jgi:asparagine N-glycosylation enzyme membrane subunit Stt3
MKQRALNWFSIADIVLLPAFILWFIWSLQFSHRWTWIIFAVWLVASFALHGDTPKTLGWRADNLGPAALQALIVFGVIIVALLGFGVLLGAPRYPSAGLLSWQRYGSYCAFCLLQQVALNSLLHNRMLSLVRNQWLAAGLTGGIFALIHWPNPVLVPATLVAGAAMAWMFGRRRNIIPLAIGQALLGTLVAWVFPMAWHHHLRVGPGYFGMPH